MGAPEEVLRLVATLEQVIGPVDRKSEGSELRPWVLAGRWEGREVRFVVNTDQGALHGLDAGVAFDGRPIMLAIHAPNTNLGGVPRVPTGDAAFDARFAVFGRPGEVLREVLDEPTRRWLLDHYGPIPPGLLKPVGIDPNLRNEQGHLFWHRHLRVTDGILSVPRGRVPDAAEIQEMLSRLASLADRAAAAFDRRHAQIAAAEGPDAAARWLAAQREALEARAAGRRAVRKGLLAIVLATALLPLVIAGCIVGALLLGGVLPVRP